jgi:hypothetical protein
MPSPYTALVRQFLKQLEAGKYAEKELDPMLSPDSVLHAPTPTEANEDHVGVAGFADYLTGLRGATDGTLEFRPQSFEFRDRGAVSLVHAVGTRNGAEFTEHLRLIFGMADGRIKEFWIDPGDRASFAKNLS